MKTKLDLIMQKMVEIRELVELLENEEGIGLASVECVLSHEILVRYKKDFDKIAKEYELCVEINGTKSGAAIHKTEPNKDEMRFVCVVREEDLDDE